MDKSFVVTVTATVRVKLDASKFTPDFMEDFRQHFFPFDTIEEHAEHIGQLAARELYSFGFNRDEFVEGYGKIGPMGIFAWVDQIETEAEDIGDPINLQGSGPVPVTPREA